MVRAWLLAAAALAVAVAPTGTAWCAIEAGQVEVAAAGSFIADLAGSNYSIYDVDVSVHKLFTDYFSSGVRLAVAGIGGDVRTIDAWLTVDLYTIGSSTAAPYLGAGIGQSMWTWHGSSDNVTIAEGHLGFKTFVSDGTAVSIEARYEANVDYFDNGILGVYAGFSVFF